METTRRTFLIGTGWAAGLLAAGRAVGAEKKEGKEGENVTPVEDLMREHGLLRRIFLVYRDFIRRIRIGKAEDMDTLAESARIVRSFVEDYHEKLEEEYLFPRFRKAGKLVDLVDVLTGQHRAGRTLTDQVIGLANMGSSSNGGDGKTLMRSLATFIRMYEPHAAREDTVLFPAFHRLVPGKEYLKMGDLFEDRENRMFGEEGFEKTVERVAAIEKKLGIYDLAKFTPHT